MDTQTQKSTNLIKTHFISNYFGQSLYKEVSEDSGHYYGKVGDDGWVFDVEDLKLKLKPISKINPTHAGEIIKLSLKENNYNINKINSISINLQIKKSSTENDIELFKIYIESAVIFDSEYSIDGIYTIQHNLFIDEKLQSVMLTDYLRKEGYLMPFMGNSCDEIMNLGWVILE